MLPLLPLLNNSPYCTYKSAIPAICDHRLVYRIVLCLWLVERSSLQPAQRISFGKISYWNNHYGDWSLQINQATRTTRYSVGLGSGQSMLLVVIISEPYYAFWGLIQHFIEYITLSWDSGRTVDRICRMRWHFLCTINRKHFVLKPSKAANISDFFWGVSTSNGLKFHFFL